MIDRYCGSCPNAGVSCGQATARQSKRATVRPSCDTLRRIGTMGRLSAPKSGHNGQDAPNLGNANPVTGLRNRILPDASAITSPTSPAISFSGIAARRRKTGTDSENILNNLRQHLDDHGFEKVQIEQPKQGNSGRFEACRTPLDDPWAQWLKAAVERSYEGTCGVLPNSGGSNVTDIIRYGLDVPFIWFPLSYGGCSQHAPNEHILKSLARKGMELVTGIYWDLASDEHAYRRP